MRAPLLGACLEGERLRLHVRASTRLTHTDPRAEQAALVVAHAVRLALASDGDLDSSGTLGQLAHHVEDQALRDIWTAMADHLARSSSSAAFAGAMGWEQGVSGYINHSVPAAVYCWLANRGDFRATIESVVRLGGDSDSTAALAGALAGATHGAAALPRDWLTGLADWPRSRAWLDQLADRLQTLVATGCSPGPAPLFWPGLPIRNGIFLAVVLAHGLRRLLPPYA